MVVILQGEFSHGTSWWKIVVDSNFPKYHPVTRSIVVGNGLAPNSRLSNSMTAYVAATLRQCSVLSVHLNVTTKSNIPGFFSAVYEWVLSRLFSPMPRHHSFVWNYVYGSNKTSCSYMWNICLAKLVGEPFSVGIYKHRSLYHDVCCKEHGIISHKEELNNWSK